MTKSRIILLLVAAVLVAGAAIAYMMQSGSGKSIPLADLPRMTHIHGIAVDRAEPSRLLVATHDGFFAVTPDGTARQISRSSDDFMGFTPHAKDPAILYASGHPAGGGNLGLISSSDGGKSWRQLSKGAGGPVDFHQMDVSKADPRVIYGVHGNLQVSRDGGMSFQSVALAPGGLIDLAASSRDAETLFAATQSGLLRSTDGGRTWQHAFLQRRPATMVETTAEGAIYAFIAGIGLMRTMEPALNFTTLSQDFGDRVLIHLAADPTDPNKLYAATQHSEILASADGGRTWRPFGAK